MVGEQMSKVMDIDQYAVFGSPIGHSLSPYIHKQFAEKTGEELSYRAEEVNAENFEQAVNAFFLSGGRGLNCTVPLKELAYQRADELTERARLSGAVNTLALNENGVLLGDNTDGLGLITDLCEVLKIPVQGKRVLILGAGGATRGILEPLLQANPQLLWLANRTIEKARVLAAEFSDVGSINAVQYSELTGKQFDLVINATSASLGGELPPLPDNLLADKAVCYDLAYGKEPTIFVKWGEANGAAKSVDGLGMLVEQAAHAFKLWRGVMPDTKGIREEIRKR